MHPDADLGAHLQSKLKWRHDSSMAVDHLCLGRDGIGGAWDKLTSKRLKTISMADWMELPNYPMETFRQQRRACRCRGLPAPAAVNNERAVRATYEEVRSYYVHYVKRNHLTNNFRNGCEVKSIKRVCVDDPFYDDLNEEIRTPEPLWEICGHNAPDGQFVRHPRQVRRSRHGHTTESHSTVGHSRRASQPIIYVHHLARNGRSDYQQEAINGK